MEGLGYFAVDVDEHVLLHQQVLVALVDLRLDPVGEGFLEQRVADVGDPLLGQLADLLGLGQVVGHDAVRRDESRDLVDREALVLWDCDPLHGVTLDTLLLAGHEVLEEVYRHLIWVGEKQIS